MTDLRTALSLPRSLGLRPMLLSAAQDVANGVKYMRDFESFNVVALVTLFGSMCVGQADWYARDLFCDSGARSNQWLNRCSFCSSRQLSNDSIRRAGWR